MSRRVSGRDHTGGKRTHPDASASRRETSALERSGESSAAYDNHGDDVRVDGQAAVADGLSGQPRFGAGAPLTDEPDVGVTLRRLREERHITLKELAARSGLTQSFLSQVERNLTSPSVASLRKVAQAFGIPLAALFQGPVTPEDRVVRRNERRQLVHPRHQWRDYLLTPNLTGKLQVILSVIEPGGGSGDEAYAHDSDEECVLVLRGRLEFWVGGDRYLLEEGDSIVFESRIPHRNANPGPGQTEVLWITTPPSY